MTRAPWFEIVCVGGLVGPDLWYFRIRAANGRILAHSEQYTRRSAALRACRAINAKMRVKEK